MYWIGCLDGGGKQGERQAPVHSEAIPVRRGRILPERISTTVEIRRNNRAANEMREGESDVDSPRGESGTDRDRATSSCRLSMNNRSLNLKARRLDNP
jgi:hypothetical protein